MGVCVAYTIYMYLDFSVGDWTLFFDRKLKVLLLIFGDARFF